MKLRWCKFIARAIVFLLLAAIVNVAVAWASAWLLSYEKIKGPPLRIPGEYPTWAVRVAGRHSGTRIQSWPTGDPARKRPVMHAFILSFDEDRSILAHRLPSWSRVRNEHPAAAEHPWVLIEDAQGWPVRSLMWARLLELNPCAQRDELLGGIPLTSLARGHWLEHKALPTTILWPGFAINTLFYAAILGLLWFTPGVIRRRVRLKRGRCPACGYIIAPGTASGGVCSECGAAVPRRAEAAM